jgi:nucleotide-binding universal stress UspA family protein
MIPTIRKIGVAIAFSPRLEALFAESVRISRMLDAELVLIHVGQHQSDQENRLSTLMTNAGYSGQKAINICWESGNPSESILRTCKMQRIDLLIAGALKKENLIGYYLGTVARRILRRAECSVLLLTEPSTNPDPFKNIVVNAEDSPFVEDAIITACHIGMRDHSSWLHVVREIKMYGLTMTASEQYSEKEYETHRQNLMKVEIDNVEKILQRISHEGLKVNIKLITGKSGFELSKFTERKHADLLVVGAPSRRFSWFDRFFPHDLEYIFADLPCNLLIVNPRTESGHG